ncbi:hypothetical protein H257_14055 [Aphanomyces astaci]|uniref:Uncharacterized protein n=1 Tax=Aphanomyces astaci TaxID=112090 RepID=W4FTU1_APHAT|nr:hypothetical protein H257_14055 [Aphanomyces astaci]ETV70371.1 hypothetical protein H257_14055 [Aphanomyces astaci]|eukprot:XP_009840083.1 hypothetical protein H257_14055 [Aphanomyces astaci]
MRKLWVSFLRLLQSVTSLLAMLYLCGIFQPVSVASQSFLETFYAIIAAVVLSCAAVIYSSVMCVLEIRSVILSTTSQVTGDIALAIMLFVVAEVLILSDDLLHCRDRINVSCGHLRTSIAFMIIATSLYVISAGLALLWDWEPRW